MAKIKVNVPALSTSSGILGVTYNGANVVDSSTQNANIVDPVTAEIISALEARIAKLETYHANVLTIEQTQSGLGAGQFDVYYNGELISDPVPTTEQILLAENIIIEQIQPGLKGGLFKVYDEKGNDLSSDAPESNAGYVIEIEQTASGGGSGAWTVTL